MNTQGNAEPVARAAAPIDPRVTIGHVHLRTADIAKPEALVNEAGGA